MRTLVLLGLLLLSGATSLGGAALFFALLRFLWALGPWGGGN